MRERIVITGMGAVTPVGIGVSAYYEGLLAGRCGIGPITRIPAETLPVQVAAEVRDFVPTDFLPHKLASELDTFMQLAIVAAEEALGQSGLTPDDRTGIIMGTALAGLALTGETQEALTVLGTHVGPRFLNKVMGNIAAAQFAIAHHLTGPSMTVSTACSSGGDAVTLAAMLLRAGSADSMVVMAGESVLSPLFFHSLHKAGALSRQGRSLPFDLRRDGFVSGEGGGAMLLETESHARARGARILAELCGCANNTDGYHVVSPQPEGLGASACMELALRDAGLTADRIGYVNAHGTATPRGDAAEAAAMHRVFGNRPVPVSSTKGATGHMMGAGGITELIACVKAIETGLLPPNLGLEEPDPACDLALVTSENNRVSADYCLSNAMGFGGQNSSVIVGRYREEQN